MSDVENQVVSLTFDNRDFEQRIESTLNSIDDLVKALDFSGSNNGFSDLKASAEGFNLDNIGAAVDNISDKFSALGAVSFTVLQSMTRTAIDVGRRIGSAITDPLLQGGAKRSLAIEQARFQFEGLGQDVEASMQSALDAVQGTAYGLDEAATLAATFGASGIQAGDAMTGALRGVAGVAAQTNRSFSEIGMIYQGIAGTQKLTGQDLIQFGTRGLNMAAKLAEQWGITEQQVREMASSGEISFMEFASAADAAFGEHAQEANKTFTGSLANMKTAVARIGAIFLTPAFAGLKGIFNALTPIIDAVKEALLPLVDAWSRFIIIVGSKTVNWLESLDLTVLTRIAPNIAKIFTNLYRAIKSVLIPIKEAFQEIFPPASADRIKEIAVAITQFTKGLKLSDETADKVKRTFAGIFAIFSIVGMVIKGIFAVFSTFMPGLASGLLSVTANLGDSLVAFRNFLAEGDKVKVFFLAVKDAVVKFVDSLDFSSAIGFVTSAFGALGDAIGNIADLFGGGGDGGGAGQSMGRLGERMGTLGEISNALGAAWDWLGDKLNRLLDFMSPVIDFFKDMIDAYQELIIGIFSGGDFSTVLDLINVGLLGGVVLLFKQFFDGGLLEGIVGGGLIDQLKQGLQGVTDVMGAMQTELRAKALLKIAFAIAILTASIIAMSLIDSAKLLQAIWGLAAVAGILFIFTDRLNAMVEEQDRWDSAQFMAMAAGIGILAVALLLLTASVYILSSMDIGDIVQGIVGLAAVLGMLYIALRFMEDNTEHLAETAIGLGLLGLALLIIVQVIKQFGEMNFWDMVQGLIGLGIALYGISQVLSELDDNTSRATGFKLLFIGGALQLIAEAVAMFAAMSFWEMVQGLIGLGAGMYILNRGVQSLPDDLVNRAAGLVLVALALYGLTYSVEKLGEMDWMVLAQGVLAMAIVLWILGQTVGDLQGSIPGAFALVIISGALYLFANVIERFADIRWQDLLFGLFGIAAALTVLGIAAYLLGSSGAIAFMALTGLALLPLAAGLMVTADAIERFNELSWGELLGGLLKLSAGLLLLGLAALILTPAIPSLFLLGIALAAIGIGIAGVGIGLWFIAQAMQAFIGVGEKAFDGMINNIKKLIQLLPFLGQQLALMFISFIGTIHENAPKIIEGVVGIVIALLNAFTEIKPALEEALIELLDMLFNIIRAKYPEWVVMGYEMLISMLTGIRDNIGEITILVAEILTNFFTALAEKTPELVESGVAFIAAWLNGVGQNMALIVTAGARVVIGFLEGLGLNMQPIIDAAVFLIVQFLIGIKNKVSDIIDAGVAIVEEVFNGVASAVSTIANGAGQLIVDILDAINNAIKKYAEPIKAAGRRIVGTLIDAITGGLVERAGEVTGAVSRFIDDITPDVGITLGPVSISTPQGTDKPASKEPEYFAVITDAANTATTATNNLENAFARVTSQLATTINTMDDFNPTIKPVLDLSDVTSEASKLSSILGSDSVSFGQAKVISAEAVQIDESAIQNGSQNGPSEVKFEQNIYAPEALSSDQIYRNTRSQIALAKEELGIL